MPVTGVTLFLLFSLMIFNIFDRSNQLEELGVSIVVCALFINALILLTSNSTDNNVSLSMGNYYLRLPISPWLLAATRIVLNCITLTITSLIFVGIGVIYLNYIGKLPNDFFSTPENYLGALAVLIILLFNYLFIQMLSWSFKMPVAIILTAAFYYVLIYFENYYFYEDFSPVEYLFLYGTGIMFPLCILISGYSLRNARSDESNPVMVLLTNTWINISTPFRRKSDSSALPFTSPVEAQRWLEHRSMLQFYKSAFAIFMSIFALSLIGMIYKNSYEMDIAFFINALLSSTIFAIINTALIVGFTNGLIHYKRQTGSIKAFIYTKPISSRLIALSRIKALMSLMRGPALFFLSVSIVYLGIVIYMATFADLSDIEEIFFRESSLELGTILLYSVGIFMGLCIFLWCVTWLFHSLSVLFIFYVLLLSLLTGFLRYQQGGELDPYHSGVGAICAMLCTLLIAGVWIYSKSKGLVAVPSKTLFLYPLVCFGLYFLIQGGFEAKHWDAGTFISALFIAALVYLPFASVPATIHLTRHR